MPIKAVAAIAPRPLFLVQGTEDAIVDPEDSCSSSRPRESPRASGGWTAAGTWGCARATRTSTASGCCSASPRRTEGSQDPGGVPPPTRPGPRPGAPALGLRTYTVGPMRWMANSWWPMISALVSCPLQTSSSCLKGLAEECGVSSPLSVAAVEKSTLSPIRSIVWAFPQTLITGARRCPGGAPPGGVEAHLGPPAVMAETATVSWAGAAMTCRPCPAGRSAKPVTPAMGGLPPLPAQGRGCLRRAGGGHRRGRRCPPGRPRPCAGRARPPGRRCPGRPPGAAPPPGWRPGPGGPPGSEQLRRLGEEHRASGLHDAVGRDPHGRVGGAQRGAVEPPHSVATISSERGWPPGGWAAMAPIMDWPSSPPGDGLDRAPASWNVEGLHRPAGGQGLGQIGHLAGLARLAAQADDPGAPTLGLAAAPASTFSVRMTSSPTWAQPCGWGMAMAPGRRRRCAGRPCWRR